MLPVLAQINKSFPNLVIVAAQEQRKYYACCVRKYLLLCNNFTGLFYIVMFRSILSLALYSSTVCISEHQMPVSLLTIYSPPPQLWT